MSFEKPLDKNNLTSEEKIHEARRKYFKKSLMEYGFTAEESEVLLESLDEFVKEEKDLTEEAKEALYKA